jgi:hypothetical protein
MSTCRALVLVLALTPLLAAQLAACPNKLPDDALTVLEKSETLQLLSLDPGAAKDKKAEDGFHGWKVLGSTVVKGKDARAKLVEALKKGVADSKGGARCFLPRHGVVATHGGKTVEFVICFECSWVHVHSGKKRDVVEISSKVQPVFDKALRDAKVPLPKGPGA